jgi:hypothetical protein
MEVNGLLACETLILLDSAVPALPLPTDAVSTAVAFPFPAASFLLEADAGAFTTPGGRDDMPAACA